MSGLPELEGVCRKLPDRAVQQLEASQRHWNTDYGKVAELVSFSPLAAIKDQADKQKIIAFFRDAPHLTGRVGPLDDEDVLRFANPSDCGRTEEEQAAEDKTARQRIAEGDAVAALKWRLPSGETLSTACVVNDTGIRYDTAILAAPRLLETTTVKTPPRADGKVPEEVPPEERTPIGKRPVPEQAVEPCRNPDCLLVKVGWLWQEPQEYNRGEVRACVWVDCDKEGNAIRCRQEATASMQLGQAEVRIHPMPPALAPDDNNCCVAECAYGISTGTISVEIEIEGDGLKVKFSGSLGSKKEGGKSLVACCCEAGAMSAEVTPEFVMLPPTPAPAGPPGVTTPVPAPGRCTPSSNTSTSTTRTIDNLPNGSTVITVKTTITTVTVRADCSQVTNVTIDTTTITIAPDGSQSQMNTINSIPPVITAPPGGGGITPSGGSPPSGTAAGVCPQWTLEERPNRTNLDGPGNYCEPYYDRSDWTWEPRQHADGLWRPCVLKIRARADINVHWPAPHPDNGRKNTANPVDGGNITETNWQASVVDMTDYDVPGGGAGPVWHSQDASKAHEEYHWEIDWLRNAHGVFNGPAANDIQALSTAAADQATARTLLEPVVNMRIDKWIADIHDYIFNVVLPGDLPGNGWGSYAAGQSVLNTLVGQVQTYRRSKGWT